MTAAARHLALARPEALARAGDRPQKAAPPAAARKSHRKKERLEMTADNSPSRSLVIADAGALPAALGPELEGAAGYARAETSEATRRAYRSDFALFRSWCEIKRMSALPAPPGPWPPF
jgi:hypothetical protein